MRTSPNPVADDGPVDKPAPTFTTPRPNGPLNPPIPPPPPPA